MAKGNQQTKTAFFLNKAKETEKKPYMYSNRKKVKRKGGFQRVKHIKLEMSVKKGEMKTIFSDFVSIKCQSGDLNPFPRCFP